MKNRSLTKIFILLGTVILALALSCSKEETVIDVSPSNIVMESANATFTISSNVAWTISQSGTFNFGISPTMGEAGVTAVNVSYTPNTATEPRTSTVTVSGGGISKTLQIVQDPIEFSISPDTLIMGASAGSGTFKITGNTVWNIDGVTIPSWIKSITPSSGSKNGELTVTVNENTSRLSENSYLLRISYGGSLTKSVEIKQDAAFNNPPTKPVPLYPANGATGISIMPTFEWSASSDVEGDKIAYTVCISEDGENWERITAGEGLSVPLPSSIGVLKADTKYHYKVLANDGNNKGVTESDVYTFTTSKKDAYADGEYVVYQESTKSNPVCLFFTGDGYTSDSYKYGGQFDEDVNEAIEAFFDIEPYKSYREYFTIYKIAAYSNQTGITNIGENSYRDTRFRLEWAGKNSTSISMPDGGDSVFELCMTIPGVDASTLKDGAIGIISNADVYAGTCMMYSDGRSISMIPYLRNSSNKTTTFKNVVQHEMGGHGFGRLADEYQNYDGKIADDDKSVLVSWQTNGYYKNVSLEPQLDKSPWAQFKGLADYTHVSMYEGGYYYKQGVWRPEKISCMEDNRSYYNSPSRYFIVERILEIAGEELTMEKFIAKDVVKSDNTGEEQTKSQGDKFRPLGKPILIK